MKAMLSSQVCALGLCLLFAGSQGEDCRKIIEEGTITSYACSRQKNEPSITAEIFRVNRFIPVTTCFMQNSSCVNTNATSYTGSVKSSSSISVDIKSVSRHETRIRCVDDKGNVISVCELEVFVWPTDATCDEVKLDSTGQNLEIKCGTDNVYPSLKGFLFRRGADIQDNEIIDGGCTQELPLNNTILAYCTWHLSVSEMTARRYTFYSKLRAYVTDYSSVTKSNVTSIDMSVDLEVPTAEIVDSSCPLGSDINQGYIMAGINATCLCGLQNISDSLTPGRARWYKSDKSFAVPDDPLQSTSTLVFRYSPSDQSQTYECQAYSGLQGATQVTGPKYTPVFAYEPTSVNIELKNGNGSLNLCSGVFPSSTLTCSSPVNPKQPGVVFSVLVNNRVVIDRENGSQSSSYTVFDAVVNHTTGGRNEVTCRAESALFPKLFVSKSAYVEVNEPPRYNPIITVTKSETSVNNVYNVSRGSEVDVTCRVESGYPAVSKTSLNCGSTSTSSASNVASIKLSVGDSTGGMRCRCSADHVTGCYQRNSEIVLHVIAAAPAQTISFLAGCFTISLALLLT